MSDDRRLPVMVAGIGGASLGTEILKCLDAAGRYDIYGCDINPVAYGHFDPRFCSTYVVDAEDYVTSLVEACEQSGASWVIAGGERPMVLLAQSASRLGELGIRLVGNDSVVTEALSSKLHTTELLEASAIPVPRTMEFDGPDDLAAFGLPCIVKPSSGSGGSDAVFLTDTAEEVEAMARIIRTSGRSPMVQEYLPHDEGEFTVGVLSLPDGSIAGSIALRRSLDTKLSVMARSRSGVISSGYSQGYIADFPQVRAQAERIATALGSRGPLNVQGRMRDGVLVPFEVNPRFSASVYLRTLAGFNEVDVLLQYLAFGTPPPQPVIREGWYLRSLTETFVAVPSGSR